MDPLSLVGTLIAVVQISGSIVSICYNYRSGVKNASSQIARMQNEVMSVRDIVERLLKLVETDNASFDLPALQATARADGPLHTCLLELTAIEASLKSGKSWRATSRALVWPLKEGDMLKSLDALARIKDTLQLAVAADNAANILEILAASRGMPRVHDSLSLITMKLSQLSEGTETRQILDWLSPVDFSAKHETHCRTKVKGTGNWLLDHDFYQTWKLSSGQPLWLNGIPGNGKTILCTAVIEDLRLHCSNPDRGLGYFYFSSTNDEGHGVEALIRTLIGQLVYQRAAIPRGLKRLYTSYEFQRRTHRTRNGLRNGSFAPPIEDFVAVLREMTSDFDSVHFVIDAIDECESDQQMEEVLDLIATTQSWSKGNVHVFLASRDVGPVRESLTSLSAISMSIEEEVISQDIRIFIRTGLDHDKKMRIWPKSLKDLVEQELMAQARGMFLWVSCQMQALHRCYNTRQVQQTLHSLPRSLDETYSRILLAIEEEGTDLALNLLQWLAFSQRKLRLTELAEVMAITCEYGGKPIYDHDLKFLDTKEILNICSSLVTISKPPQTLATSLFEVNDQTEVMLAHHSVKEFLTSQATRTGPCSRFGLEQKLAHHSISSSCLSYLIQASEIIKLGSVEQFPLLDYAARFWLSHMDMSKDLTQSQPFAELILDFFDPKSLACTIWTQNYNFEMPWYRPDIIKKSERVPAVYCAAALGLDNVIRVLIEKGVDVHQAGGLMGNALQVASYHGHLSTVQLLLDAGAEVDKLGGLFRTAVTAAANENRALIVNLLLDRGASPQARHGRSDRRGDALFIAAGNGNLDICKALLNHGAKDYEAMKSRPNSALHAAAMNGHGDIVQEILLRDAGRHGYAFRASRLSSAENGDLKLSEQLKLYDKECTDELAYASLAGDLVGVRQLLAAGADKDKVAYTLSDSKTPLEYAISQRRVAVVEELLAQGADPHKGMWKPLLSQAAGAGSCAIIGLLLKYGADLNSSDCPNYHLPLVEAIRVSDAEAVRYMIDAGADLHACNDIALGKAAASGDLSILRYLIDCGGDMQSCSSELLQDAARGGHFEVFQFLIAKGAKMPVRTVEKTSLLLAASGGGSARLVRYLLNNGVDANENIADPEQDSLYSHAMYQALGQDSKIAIALLEAGLDPNVMIQSNSVLCEAIKLEDEMVALYLIDQGADVNKTKGKEHGTPLLYAIKYNLIAIVQELLDHEADVEATGTIYGRLTTPLLLAAEKGSIEIVQMLLAKGASVNAQNDQGFSALHVAAGEGHDKLLRILVHEHEADLRVALFNGSLPIHSAASRGTPICIELLLDAGSDVDATNNGGRTPLHWAAESRRWGNVRTLLDRGAKTSIRAGESKLTALDLARLGQQNLSEYPSFYQPEKGWSKEDLDLLFERMGI